MSNDNKKDIANSLNKYTDYINKGTNLVLDSVENINKWYSEQLNKITKNDIDTSRIETGVDNSIKKEDNANKNEKEISTTVKQYNEIQINKNNDKSNIGKLKKIQTISENDNNIELTEGNKTLLEKNARKLKNSKRIATIIKGAKLINNSAQKIIRTGKTINTGLTENSTTAFKGTSSKIMTKPIKKISSKTSNRVTKETIKYTKKVTKKIENKINKKNVERIGKKAISETTNIMTRLMKILAKLMADAVKLILSMLPQIAPIIIIIVIIVAIGNFLNLENIKDADGINFDEVSQLMIAIEDEKLQAIYNEFLKNIGKPYLMDHSNLKYDECMDYYDCSSWVIHCLAHCGVKAIPNTGAEGIYRHHCLPISVEDRQAGDLIFLKNTYGNFPTEGIESITHIGIYMGTLSINGETTEWVIDTGSNPSGVRIRKYNNGWWNGPNFYGFGRLKQ